MPAKKQKMKTKKTVATNKSEFLAEAKNLVNELSGELNNSVLALPSIVINTKGKKLEAFVLIEDKVEIDIEMIRMLEDFFERLVQLLNLRTSYDMKILKLTKMIIRLNEIKTLTEFKGNLQLIGIGLNELEQIAKNYQELYTILFTEQAMLQFQLMEQLMIFRDKDISSFANHFSNSLIAFNRLNEKIIEIQELDS